MGVKGVYKRMPTISVRFITSTDTFTLQTNTAENASDASVLTDGSLVEQVISFNTENDMSNDTPVFSLVLAGLDRWDRILQPNDIVTIKVNPGDGNTVVNDVIMVGMVSEVKKLGSYGEASVVYQVSGQSMAKALMQLKLGTLQEIASITQSFGWMSGMGTKDQSGNEILTGEHLQPKYTKSFGVKALNIKSGEYKDIDGDPIKGDSDTIAIVDKSTGIKNNTWISVEGYGDVKARVTSSTSTLEDITLGAKKDIYIDVSSKSARDSYNKKYDKKKAKVKVYDSKKSPDQYYKDSKKSDGKVKADSSGLMFTGKTAADVVENIIRWFMNLSGDDLLLTSSLNNTDIHYTFNGDRKNFGDWVELNLSSRSEDEMLLDALPLMSFTGSLRQMITQAQAKPYNEFYVDFTSDEKAVFNMRPTPFEPDDWNALQSNAIRLESYNVIEESLSHNDNEVYSVFSSSIPNSITLNTVSDLMMYPVYFPGLTQRYGYSMLEQQNDYIFRSKENEKTKGGSDSSGSLDMASGDTKTNAKNIASALKKAGASGQGIAALLGTMQGESNLIPSTIQGGRSYDKSTAYSNAGGYGFGLAQWDATRRVGLLKYADSNKKSWDNLGLQVSYLLAGDTAANTIKELLVRTDSVESIVADMVAKWEVPKYPSEATAKRIPMAKAWYSELSLSSVKGEGRIDVSKIGKGKTLTQALGIKNKSNKTLTEAMGKSSNPYPSFSDVVKKQYEASKSKADKKKKQAAKIDADNVNLAKKYSVYLANWYGNNNSFISGEIRVVGNPDYRVGNVLLRYDPAVSEWGSREYVYYIESVSHEFSYTGGYTTTLGVTRGLPGGVNRFATWNTSDSELTADKPGNGGLQFFNGGLFGELSVAEAADKGFKEADGDDKSNDGGSEGSEDGVGTGDDYPSKWRDAIKDHVIDDWRYYNRECVSFVAWRLSQKKKYRDEKDPSKLPFYFLGNAWEWNKVDSKYHQSSPKVGDVALFGPGAWGAGALGHVAMVSKVDGDTIYTEDYNAGNPGGQYGTHSMSASTPTKYLRF